MTPLQSRIHSLIRTVALLRRLTLEMTGLLMALAGLVAVAAALIDRWL